MRSSVFATFSAAVLLSACGSQHATPAVTAGSLATHARSAAAKPADTSIAANPGSLHFDTPSDAAQTVTIVISNPPITAVSADSTIATVSFEHGHTVHTGTDGDDRYVTLTITPIGFGYTTINVTDKHGGSIEIPVQIGGGHAME